MLQKLGCLLLLLAVGVQYGFAAGTDQIVPVAALPGLGQTASYIRPAAYRDVTGYDTGERQVIRANDVLQSALQLVRQRAGVPAEDNRLMITPLNLPADIELPPGTADYYIELPYGVRFNFPTVVYAVVTLNGQAYTKVSLSLDVRLFQDVVVAARSLAANELIAPDSIKYERMDIGRLSQGYMTNLVDVAGMQARRTISPGTPLNKYMLAQPEVIKRGAMVSILVRMGDMEVMATGEAMQNGSVGDIIRVRNVNSKKVVTAQVLDGTSVLISLYR
ncbi:flagellar basal body P-ring formation chaperone FlgA [Propionispora hippei]|uniref:Flagella basal body P-ring formation protein FlgA n=1 Tax=Propionispora hippei DSM 15287 TaxID=1123003 RepID=A0A1M6BTI2_9FIRM|nr:flagellar basal body P-ring formation chaperone FlgA [Propionispora hippei]SHI51808.1 flagella basal body P-ring formation protein FlgA [Propionispora hippei DSM 15287]